MSRSSPDDEQRESDSARDGAGSERQWHSAAAVEGGVVSMIDRARVTVKDVARLAGVSTATVTRTLQNSGAVRPETRRRVTAAVEQLGYRPNPMARDLRRRGSSAAVGLAIASFRNAFQTGVAAGAERELRRVGLHLLIGSSDLDPAHEPEVTRAMLDRRVGALMMMSDGAARDPLTPDRLFGTPVVLIGRPSEGIQADVVTPEDDRAVDEATESLIELGHVRIAAVAGDAGTVPARQRLLAFRTALARHGIESAADSIVENLGTSVDAARATGHLLGSPDPPTAILALDPEASTGVLIDRITHRRRTACIAFDESELSIGLGVSAIARDPEELGRLAALLAVSRIEDPDRPVRTVVLTSRLIARGSGEISARDSRW